MISQHLDKNNLHHAYLIEGRKEEIIPEIIIFLNGLGINTKNNSDFNQINLDSFKIEDARNLKSQSIERGISNNLPNGQAGKKVFIISVNNFLIDAQNTLLKMFEEPIEHTIFFLIVPDIAIILPTILSRFYLIKSEANIKDELKQAENFISLPLAKRIDFIKEFTAKTDDSEDENGLENVTDSVRSKAIKFLNAIETILHQKLLSKGIFDKQTDYFEQIFKAREYLSQPGSSTKSLMESVALVVPKL